MSKSDFIEAVAKEGKVSKGVEGEMAPWQFGMTCRFKSMSNTKLTAPANTSRDNRTSRTMTS